MNGRLNRFNKSYPSISNSWGQTTDENPTLLIYVRNIPKIATLDEYRRFFENSGKVVGIRVSDHYAIIKFERPHEADHAISRTLETFNGCQLRIEKYRSLKNNGRAKYERSALEKAMQGFSGSTRHQTRSRSANRFRSRSRSSSPSQRRHRQSSAFVDRTQPVQDRSVYGASINFSRAPPPERSSWLNHRDSNLPGLPQEIRCLLDLMVVENTARNLSFSQIQMLINFLEHEKEYVWGPRFEQTMAQSEQQQQQPIEVDQPIEPETTNGTPQEVQAAANTAQDEPEPYESEEDDEISEDQKILEMLAEATGRG